MPTVAYLRDSIIVLMFMKFEVGPIPKYGISIWTASSGISLFIN